MSPLVCLLFVLHLSCRGWYLHRSRQSGCLRLVGARSTLQPASLSGPPADRSPSSPPSAFFHPHNLMLFLSAHKPYQDRVTSFTLGSYPVGRADILLPDLNSKILPKLQHLILHVFIFGCGEADNPEVFSSTVMF